MNINFKFLLLGTSLSLIPNVLYAQCTTAQTCASLGYTQTSCPNGGIKCPFGNGWYCRQEVASQEPEKATLGKCTGYAANCNIADILNSDGTCTSNVVSGKSPLGVVIAIKDNCGYAMTASPIQKEIFWSTEYVDTGIGTVTIWSEAITNFDACANTQKIIQQSDSSKYPAAWAAVNYAPSAAPATKGKWCLPAPGMLNSLYTNLNSINSTISKLGGTQLPGDNEHIWSSSEYSISSAWVFWPVTGLSMNYIFKDTYGTIRPVLAF